MHIRVAQMDGDGCAVAAIATIVGKSYDAVGRRAFGRRWTASLSPGLYTSQIIRVLRSYGMRVGKRVGFDFRSGHSAILFADLSCYWKGRKIWHCLVWDPDLGGRLIDPSWKGCDDHQYYLKAWRYGGRETLVIRPRLTSQP